MIEKRSEEDVKELSTYNYIYYNLRFNAIPISIKRIFKKCTCKDIKITKALNVSP